MSPPLRVAHIVPRPEFVRHIMIHDLRRLRPHTTATVICSDGADVAAVRAEGFRVIAIPIARKIAPLHDLVTLWRLIRVLRHERFDLVHTYVPKAGLLGQLAAAAIGAHPRIHSCRGLLYRVDLSAWRRRLYRLIDRATNTIADCTIYISAADRDHSVQEGLCSAEKARYTGSGIDLDHFRIDALPVGTREAVRAELDIPSDATVLLTVGRFVVDKGYRELAAAARALHGEHPNARFVWVAPILPDESETLDDDFIARHGLADVVIRLPMQNDIRRMYLAADLLVHPSYKEGVPRVLMEAAAMGVPIVASGIPGCREVIESERTGILVNAHDADALLEGLRRALADPDSLRRFAAVARREVRQRFSQDRLTDRVWQVYREALDRPMPAERGHERGGST